jgi:predicted DsbA family dithiol-disulfide isomerase
LAAAAPSATGPEVQTAIRRERGIVTVQIEVWSDFVCPYCFYAASALNLLEEMHDVAVEWHSFELRPAGTVIPDWYLERIQQSRPRIHQMMWETFGIQLNIGPFGISTRKALIGAKVAAAQGKAIEEAYHRAVLQAYWLEARDISGVSVLAELAAKAGMQPDVFLSALDDPAYDDAVALDIELGRQIGISGVPAHVFEKRYYLPGAQPLDVLREVVEKVETERQQNSTSGE